MEKKNMDGRLGQMGQLVGKKGHEVIKRKRRNEKKKKKKRKKRKKEAGEGKARKRAKKKKEERGIFVQDCGLSPSPHSSA